MGRRHSLIILELVAAVTAAMSVLAGIAFFLLTMGPIRLDFLTPYIESALSPDGGSIGVRIDSTKLTWDGWQRPVDVRAERVRIVNPAGTELATLDEVSIGLSIPGLMRGLVAPTSLEIRKPTVRLTRARDGHLEFGLGDSAQGREQPALQRLIEGLLAPLNPQAASGYLERVSISDATLALDDQMLEMSWRAQNAGVEMARNEHGIAARFQVPFILDDKPAVIGGTVLYAMESEAIELSVQFSDIVPARFAAGSPTLDRLSVLNFPVSGQIDAWMHGTEIQRVAFDLVGGKGRLMLPELGQQGIEVNAAKIVGRAEQGLSLHILENVYFDFGGANVSAAAVISQLSDQPLVQANAIARKLSVTDLERLWPATLRPELRDWVRSHVQSGRADETTIAMVGRLTDRGFDPDYQKLKMETRFSGVTAQANDSLLMQNINGTVKFGPDQLNVTIAGGNAKWLRGDLPPFTDIKARATLVPNRFAEISLSEAKFGGLNLTAEKIRVNNLDKPVPEVDGEAHVYGPLGKLVTMLQKSNLGGINELEVDPNTVKGVMGLKTRFRFDLGPQVNFDRVSRTATMTIQDLSIPKGPMGLAITDGDLKLVYDARDLRMDGQLRLNGTPVSIDLKRTMVGNGPNPTHIHLVGVLNDLQRKALGLDTDKFLSGPVDFVVDLMRTDGVTTTANTRLKLDRAKLKLAQLYWEKDAKTPLSLDMILTMRKGQAVEVSEFAMNGGGMKADGRAWFAPGSPDIQRIKLERLAFNGKDGTDVKAQFERRAGGRGWSVELEGAQLNLQPYIDDPDIIIDFPLDVKTRLKRLRLDARRTLHDVDLAASYGGEYWDRINLESQRGTNNDFRVRYQPADDQSDQRNLYIYSNDAGFALQFMTEASIAKDVRGGDLLIKATRYPMRPNSPMEGLVELRSFSLRDSPTGEKILASSAGFGPFELLSNSDLNFAGLDAQFRKNGDRIELVSLQALSQGLGINLAGVFDAAQGTLDIEGYVSPFRGLCEVLNDTPWVGAFLVGTDKQGLIAVDVRAQGSFSDPEFIVSKKPRSLPRGELREFARMTNACSKIKDLSPENRIQPAGINK